jgi:hypothetical protein
MVEERQGVVPEESDDEIVVQTEEVEGIRKEKRDPEICQYELSRDVYALTSDLSRQVACIGTAPHRGIPILARML